MQNSSKFTKSVAEVLIAIFERFLININRIAVGIYENLFRSVNFILEKKSFSSSDKQIIAQIQWILVVGSSNFVIISESVSPHKELVGVVEGVN